LYSFHWYFPVQLSGKRKAPRVEVPALKKAAGKPLQKLVPRHGLAVVRSREVHVGAVAGECRLVIFAGKEQSPAVSKLQQ